MSFRNCNSQGKRCRIFLGEPDKLDRFLDEIFANTGMEISIKTSVGTDYEEDWERLLEIYSKYPIKGADHPSTPSEGSL